MDISLEWYYGDQSLLSLGYYRKDVQNFVGTEIVDQTLFDLRDATSGAPGSRSGDAAAALEQQGFPVTERNLFTMTAILDNPVDFPGGAAEYENSQTFADAVFSAYDVIPDANDPLFIFGVQQPLNTQTATIYGFEFVTQHWFGDTGFGYSLNYTTVEGDIEYDIGGDPTCRSVRPAGPERLSELCADVRELRLLRPTRVQLARRLPEPGPARGIRWRTACRSSSMSTSRLILRSATWPRTISRSRWT